MKCKVKQCFCFVKQQEIWFCYEWGRTYEAVLFVQVGGAYITYLPKPATRICPGESDNLLANEPRNENCAVWTQAPLWVEQICRVSV